MAKVDMLDVQGVDYVSLPGLTRQLGGVSRVSAARVHLEWGSLSAAAELNNTRVVDTAGEEFFLRYPLVSRGGDALIGLADVQTFYHKAFGLTLRREGEVMPQDTPPELDVSAVPKSDQAMAQVPPAPVGAPESMVQTEPAPAAPTPVAKPTPPPADGAPVIVLDPGHGGNDAGCVGPGGLTEKALTLAIAKEVRRLLKEGTGLQVFLTRAEDQDVSIRERRRVAEQHSRALLVSLHMGASFAEDARGFEVFCPAAASGGRSSYRPRAALGNGESQSGRFFAETVSRELSVAASEELREVREVPLRLFADRSLPGFLVELGCLSNPSQEARLGTQAYQAQLAQGIATGIAVAAAQEGAGGDTP